MGISVQSAEEHAIVLGDVAVHPAQISNPDVTYAFDIDPEEAAITRRLLFERLEGSKASLCSHFPRGGFGRVVGEGGSPYWMPAA
jgi:hypothetical protein